MNTINDIQNEIIEEFELFDSWMDRYEYIIDLGKKVPLIENAFKIPERLIPGCQSQVWLHAEKTPDNTIIYTADSDALITRGIISLLIRVLSGQAAKDIAAADLYFIERIGLQQHLSPTRANGLLSMVQQMQAYARAFE